MENKTPSWIEIFILFFLFIFLTYIIPFIPGHQSDRGLWIYWTEYIYNNGLSKTYYSGTDYLPLYHYFLYFFGKFFNNTESIAANINYLRCFTLAFDFIGLWYVYKFVDKKFSYFIILLFSILNISYSYNTILWGQVDGILSTLIFISIYYAWKKKLIISAIFLVLALNFKLQAIIFLPVWALLYLNNVLERKSIKNFIFPLLAIFIIQLIILLPFMKDDNGLQMIWNVISGSVGRYPRISMNAFNFWHILIHNPWDRTDDETFAGISLRNIGLILFFLTSFITLIPLIKNLYQNSKNKISIDRRIILLTCSLIAILFFFFNTQMHERYCHPAFIFLTAYAFYTKDFLPYATFSAAYFLNMEQVLQVLRLENYGTFIFEPETIAILFLSTIIILMYRLFKVKPVLTPSQ